MSFKDHFSGHSSQYAQFRPQYPLELFSFLQSISPGRELAWDCATGNGQAAVYASGFFDRVIATDASAGQLAQAIPDPNVEYRQCPAEDSGLGTETVDLVTVAQALHWLPLNEMFREAERVLKPGGILAAWCYNLLRISSEIDETVARFYYDIVGPYWPPERTLVEAGYSNIDFPFEKLDVPPFTMTADWTLDHVVGYIDTWSATQRFKKERGSRALEELSSRLAELWGEPSQARHVEWPLSIRVVRKPSAT